MYSNNKISARQLKRMLILESIGISVLMSTEVAVYFAGRDGIFSIILAGIMTYAYGWCVLWVCEKVKWKYWEYINKYVGRILKNIIAVFFIIKYLILGSLAFVVLNKIVKIQVMDELNHIIIFLAAMAVCLYGVLKGIEARGRLMEFVFIVTLLPIWVLIIFALRGTDIYYITPLLINGGKDIFLGGIVLFFLFSPLEMILFLSDNISSDDYKKVKNIKMGVYGGITYVLIANIIIFVLNVGHLGVNTISDENISTVGLMKTISFSNYILEKQSGIFLVFFITALLLTIIGIVGQTVNLAWKVSGNKNLVAVACIVLIIGFGAFGIINNVKSYENVLAAGNKRVEIENREYVDGILIDYNNEGYSVLMSFRDEENKGRYNEYKVDSINDLEQEYKKTSDKSLDYSNLQAVMFGDKVIKNHNIFKNILDMFDRQQSVPENVSIYIAGSEMGAYEKAGNEKSIGSYLAKLTKNNLEYAITTLRDIRKVMNETEECCLLSRFIVKDEEIQPDGLSIIGGSGHIEDYSEEDSGYIRMIYGNSGIYIKIAGNSYRVDKNKYFVNVKEAENNRVSAKIVYSGKITPMSDSKLTQEEVNILMEKFIQEKLTLLMEEYDTDLINIYKHMSASDRSLWVMYNSSRQELHQNMDISVQTEFQVINSASR